MKIHMRADKANGTHTKFTVFMNNINCGQLRMTQEEAIFFHDVVLRSTWFLETDEVISSGLWFKEIKES